MPSNITGVYLGQSNIGKMKNTGDWPTLMDTAIQAVLKECAALPKDKGQEVWDENVQGKWVKGKGIVVTLLKRNMSNEPWNIACKQCNGVKNKTVPKWLTTGIPLDRASYGIVTRNGVVDATKIDDAMKDIQKAIEKRFGKGHLSP
jgi:hypothetical protein